VVDCIIAAIEQAEGAILELLPDRMKAIDAF
jgi:hypothetical protein